MKTFIASLLLTLFFLPMLAGTGNASRGNVATENITAGFKVKQQSGPVPFTVYFEAMEQNPNLSFKWDFGNDQFSSEKPITVSRFENPGTYTVRLIVSNELQSDTNYMSIEALPSPAAIVVEKAN